jgi:hypothetical protein
LDAGDADYVDSDARQAPDAGHIGVLQNALNNRQGSTLAWETARPSHGHERDTRSSYSTADPSRECESTASARGHEHEDNQKALLQRGEAMTGSSSAFTERQQQAWLQQQAWSRGLAQGPTGLSSAAGLLRPGTASSARPTVVVSAATLTSKVGSTAESQWSGECGKEAQSPLGRSIQGVESQSHSKAPAGRGIPASGVASGAGMPASRVVAHERAHVPEAAAPRQPLPAAPSPQQQQQQQHLGWLLRQPVSSPDIGWGGPASPEALTARRRKQRQRQRQQLLQGEGSGFTE